MGDDGVGGWEVVGLKDQKLSWGSIATAQPDATAAEPGMAMPPVNAHLGKSARDVFTKGYGECCSSRAGLACLGFYPPRFERCGSVSS